MEINEIKAEKIKLENDISLAVGELVEAFKSKTGCSPQHICISTVELQILGPRFGERVVGEARIDITI